MTHLRSRCQTTAEGTSHGHGAAEVHNGESLGVPQHTGTAEGGWDQSRCASSSRSPYKPTWSCNNLPSLIRFALHFEIYVLLMLCSFLTNPGIEFLSLMCSGIPPPASAWWHQCSEKQDLCRNGDAGYTGCLLNVPGTFTVHFYRWPL